jgi:hypothetical protein
MAYATSKRIHDRIEFKKWLSGGDMSIGWCAQARTVNTNGSSSRDELDRPSLPLHRLFE